MGIEKSKGEVQARAAHDTFRTSLYGQSLAGEPRWDMQRPEHVSAQEWIRILGRDADNLEHMKLSFDITNLFLHFDDGSLGISEDEKDILRIAAISHDWGESHDDITGRGGDINYELKTDLDTMNEQEIFRMVFDHVMGPVDVKTKHLIEATIFKKDTKLGMVFDAIERIGYLRTAIIAFTHSKETDDPILKSHLEWLAAGTLSNQVTMLMEYAANYTPVKKYLDIAAPSINEIYDALESSIFSQHGQPQHEKRNLYNQSKVLWRHSTSQVPTQKKANGAAVFTDSPSFESRYLATYEDAEKKAEACRTLGMKIVLTSGSFDLMHVGHMRYIEKAREYGDMLFVGVDSDTKIRERKGPDRPVVDETERMQMLSHTRGVDFIVLKQPTDKKWQLIRTIHPDILIATSETYTPEEIEILERDYCGRVVVLEPQATTSTSARIRKLNIGWSRQIIQPILQEIDAGVPIETLKEKFGNVIQES